MQQKTNLTTKELVMSYLELRKINVNEHTEKKGKFTYLSWAWAVDQLLQAVTRAPAGQTSGDFNRLICR